MSFSIDGVIACATYLIAISAGAQGVTETIKNAIPWLTTEKVPLNPDSPADVSAALRLEGYRQGILKIIASLSAMLLIWLAKTNPSSFLFGGIVNLDALQIISWGLVSSFGAPFLNQLLNILSSIKDTRNALIDKKPPQQKVVNKK